MGATQQLVAWGTVVCEALLLAAIARRRWHRLCYTFPAYLLVVLVCSTLMLGWSSRFWVWSFWLFKETLYGLLKFALALELTAVVFQAFPGARASARRLLAFGLLALLAVMVWPPPALHDAAGIAQDLQPRLANGTALIFMLLFGLALWYRIPLHPWHRAILIGFVPYLLIFSVALSLITTLGWAVRANAGLASSVAYLLMLAYWLVVAVRPEPAPPADPEVVRRLQPWRDRLARP